MNFRRQAVEALAREIHVKTRVNDPPMVIDRNPSEVADYPRISISLDRFILTSAYEEELQVRDDALAIGNNASLDDTSLPLAKIDSVNRLSRIGTFRGNGRMWVGCRYPAKREEIEHKITELFNQDTLALGRLLVSIRKPKIGELEIPWSWSAAFFTGERSWTDERAASERVWSWMNYDVEVDALMIRNSPLVQEFGLAVDASFTVQL